MPFWIDEGTPNILVEYTLDRNRSHTFCGIAEWAAPYILRHARCHTVCFGCTISMRGGLLCSFVLCSRDPKLPDDDDVLDGNILREFTPQSPINPNSSLGMSWLLLDPHYMSSHQPLVITNRSGKLIDLTEENLLIKKFSDHFNFHFNINKIRIRIIFKPT